MANWAPLYAAAALCAALVGFGGAPGLMAGLGQILFFLCSIALLVTLVLSSARGAAD